MRRQFQEKVAIGSMVLGIQWSDRRPLTCACGPSTGSLQPLGAGCTVREGARVLANRQAEASPTSHIRHIEVVAEATTIKGWRKQVVAGQKGSQRFTFISDEGSYMPGGEGTAPTPLTYFTAGVAL